MINPTPEAVREAVRRLSEYYCPPFSEAFLCIDVRTLLSAFAAETERLNWLQNGYHRTETWINLAGEKDIRSAIDTLRGKEKG